MAKRQADSSPGELRTSAKIDEAMIVFNEKREKGEIESMKKFERDVKSIACHFPKKAS